MRKSFRSKPEQYRHVECCHHAKRYKNQSRKDSCYKLAGLPNSTRKRRKVFRRKPLLAVDPDGLLTAGFDPFEKNPLKIDFCPETVCYSQCNDQQKIDSYSICYRLGSAFPPKIE